MENINNVTEETVSTEEVTTEEKRTLEEEFKELLRNIDPLLATEEITAFIAEHAGIMGASAVIALLLRNQDLSGLKGFGKICAGVGIVGLAGAAGTAAGKHLDRKVRNFFGFFKNAKNGKINIKIGKTPETT